MTALSDFLATVKEWVDDINPTDALVTSWVRLAEQRINDELRVDEMIRRQYATFDDNCATLPDDWLKTIYVRPEGGLPFAYVANKAYWELSRTPSLVQPDPYGPPPYPGGRKGFYTNIGRQLFVWPAIDPAALTNIEVAYYHKVMPLADTADPVFDRFPGIYLNCTLAAGAPYLVEDERLGTFAMLATAQIKMANDQATASRFSGAPLTPVIRSFG